MCLQEYLVRVRYQMTEWFTNILSREQEVVSQSTQSVSQSVADLDACVGLENEEGCVRYVVLPCIWTDGLPPYLPDRQATNSQGQPITSAPEDFFNIIHLQVRSRLVFSPL